MTLLQMETCPPRKPAWLRVKMPAGETYFDLKRLVRQHRLHTVCEEASCPNIGECFGKGTATFMILGDICTRRCPFCDVAHGRRSLRMEASRCTSPRRLRSSSSPMW